MSNENAELIRRACQAYASGDLKVLRPWAEHALRAELEEVTSADELVMVGVRTPGVDALRDCRDRQEALQLAGIQT